MEALSVEGIYSDEDIKTYKKLKTLKVIGKNTGKKKNIHVTKK